MLTGKKGTSYTNMHVLVVRHSYSVPDFSLNFFPFFYCYVKITHFNYFSNMFVKGTPEFVKPKAEEKGDSRKQVAPEPWPEGKAYQVKHAKK